MTTNFQTLLKKHAIDLAYDDTEDYFFGHVGCFLSAAAKVIMADGLPRESVMALYITHAFHIMNFDKPVPAWKQTGELILQTVLRHLSEGYPRKAIELPCPHSSSVRYRRRSLFSSSFAAAAVTHPGVTALTAPVMKRPSQSPLRVPPATPAFSSPFSSGVFLLLKVLRQSKTTFKKERKMQSRKTYIPRFRISLVRETRGTYPEQRLSSSTDADRLLQPLLAHLDREHFVVIGLDAKNSVIGVNTVSIGSLTLAIVHPREVYKPLILMNAAGYICAHNHPSGNTTPSNEDHTLTARLKEAGEILCIRLLDHIIIGEGKSFSFADNGCLS